MKPQTSLSFLSVGIQMCAIAPVQIVLFIKQTTQACGSMAGGVYKFISLAVLEGGGF